MNKHFWSQEQLAWLRENYQVMSRSQLAQEVRAVFDLDVTYKQVVAALKNHKIRCSRTGRFESGQKAWNDGLKGSISVNRTSFRPGRTPHNTKQLWHERVNVDGYVEIQVPETNPHTGYKHRYKHKHVWLWEQQQEEKVPAGHAVIFKDGDSRNFDSDNLVLVTRAELLVMNLHGYKDAPEELKPSIMALARVEAKAGIRTKPGRGRSARRAEGF
jgi:hypothetical protein